MNVRRKRCVVCHLLTKNWQRVNGSPWYCFDGCHSTTGMDRRTVDGKPAWLEIDGKKAWDESRLIPGVPR